MSVSRRFARFFAFSVALAAIGTASHASAGPFDLDDEDEKKEAKASTKPSDPVPPVPAAPVATIRPHAYTLTECLLLAERNFPLLWAARARLAVVHAQLDEARWTPFSNWGMSSAVGYGPPIGGTPFYNASPYSLLYTKIGDGWQPAFNISVNGQVPLYTFGKIESIKAAAEANVRVNEWDLEKSRQQLRMDVRRAFYGLMLARDAQYIGNDILGTLGKAIDGIQKKLDAGDNSVDEIDRIRLDYNRDEIVARLADAKKGEQYANAALRFLTGVQTAFDIPDEPLKRPENSVAPVVRYLTAARLFRADLNMARAGVQARKAMVEFRRAEMYPNIGINLGFGYSVAPGVVQQTTAWIGDSFNRFGPFFPSAGLGLQWNLDVLPRSARLAAAESQLEEARAMERLALGGVAVEVENAYAAVVEAKTREESWERAEHRSKRWISNVQDAIELGTKDERYLIEPLRAYLSARALHVQALMDLHVTMSELARVSGYDRAAPGG